MYRHPFDVSNTHVLESQKHDSDANFFKKKKNKQKKRKQELCKLRKGSRGKTINEMKTSTRVDNFNFVGLAGGEAARGEEAGTDKKKGENGGVLVHDRQCPSRG